MGAKVSRSQAALPESACPPLPVWLGTASCVPQDTSISSIRSSIDRIRSTSPTPKDRMICGRVRARVGQGGAGRALQAGQACVMKSGRRVRRGDGTIQWSTAVDGRLPGPAGGPQGWGTGNVSSL